MSMLHEFSQILEKRSGNNRSDDDEDYSLHKWNKKDKSNKDSYKNDDKKDKKFDRNDKPEYKTEPGNIGLIKAANKRFIDSKINTVNELDELARKMTGFKFGEKLADAFRSMDKDGTLEDIGPSVGAMMFEIMNNNRGKYKGDLEDNYISMIDKLIKPRVTELGERMKKRHRPSKTILREIAIVLPTDEIIDPKKNIFEVVGTVNDKLYAQAEEWFKKGKDEESSEETEFSVKGIRKLYEALYTEEYLTKVAIGCLLEKRENFNKIKTKAGKDLWNTVTEFALDTLNDVEDKKELDDLLANYTYARFLEFETDSGRRVILRDVDEESYETLAKAVKRMCKDERLAGRLA